MKAPRPHTHENSRASEKENAMKCIAGRILIACLLSCAGLLAGCPGTSGSTTLLVQNLSSCPIAEVYVVDAGEEDWGPNRIEAPISTQETAEFEVPNGSYNIRIVDECGHTAERLALALEGASQRLNYTDPGEGEPSIEPEGEQEGESEGEGSAEGAPAAEGESGMEGEAPEGDGLEGEDAQAPALVGAWSTTKDLGEVPARQFVLTFYAGNRFNHVYYTDWDDGLPDVHSAWGAYAILSTETTEGGTSMRLSLDFDADGDGAALDTESVILFTDEDHFYFTENEPSGAPTSLYARDS